MIDVLIQMGGLILCGVLWRAWQPGGLQADAVRPALTALVYYILLPALILRVLWQAPLGADSLRLALLAAATILLALATAAAVYRVGRTPPRLAGALVLAAAFPNVIYLGLPVVGQALGTWAQAIIIQYDLFAAFPLLMTVGVLIAQHYGQRADGRRGTTPLTPRRLLRAFAAVPPLWAGIAAVGLNLGGVGLPEGLDRWLELLGNGVVPLMLIALGMALRWDVVHWRRLPVLAPALVIQLALMPLFAWWAGPVLGLPSATLAVLVLGSAMPSMVIGLVFCDRHGLDTGAYAAAVTLSTACSALTLPLWHALVG
ncbi:AEC family transporter [Ectothiorhodospiraceae bacterium 2226]|nr:AEC family transporter [Ectothiorhodospiraceae bacterium 2226]